MEGDKELESKYGIQGTGTSNGKHRNISMRTSESGEIPQLTDSWKLLTLQEYLYESAFTTGKFTDVVLKVFGTSRRLHRLVLCRCSFFSNLLGELWNKEGQDGDNVYEIDFSHDQNITADAFEIFLKTLYGDDQYKSVRSVDDLLSLFAVSNYLDFPELIEFTSKAIADKISQSSVGTISQFFHHHEYGKTSTKVLEACRDFISEVLYDLWYKNNKKTYNIEIFGEVPLPIMNEVLSSDGLFVPSEETRCYLFLDYYRSIENRWKASREIECSELGTEQRKDHGDNTGSIYIRLPQEAEKELEYTRRSLNEGIHFFHIEPSAIIALEEEKDIRGNRIIDKKALRESLWLHQELKSVIKSSSSTELGVTVSDFRQNGDEEDIFYPVPTTEGDTEDDPLKWTKYPPFRFSVNFSIRHDMEHGKRTYSETLWYAGSYWNVYVIQNKANQIGIYLHRTKACNNKVDFADRDDEKTNNLNNAREGTGNLKTEMGVQRGSQGHIEMQDHYYFDNRQAVKVYFQMYTPSLDGYPTLLSFSSSPEEFHLYQSWGWETDSLLSGAEEGGRSIKVMLVMSVV